MAKFKAQLIAAASAATGSRKLVFLARTLIMLPLWLRATAARHAASGVRAASTLILITGSVGASHCELLAPFELSISLSEFDVQ